MAVSYSQIMTQGGKTLHDLLSFAVYSVRPDGLFVFLAHEYHLRPTAAAAVALYDLFCAPGSPARLSVDTVLPPQDPRLAAALAPIRFGLDRSLAPPPDPLPEDPPWEPAMPPLPPNYLFSGLAERLLNDPVGQVVALSSEFDPDRGPFGSLTGGKLSSGQRAFAEQVWRRRVQPALVAAGFWRVATVGQL